MTFFFILSGAILAYNYPAAIDVRRFYRKRVARIYPVYLLAFVVGVVVLAGTTQTVGFFSAELFAKNLTMLTGWFPDGQATPPTAWTLSCEMFFYALFPFLLVALRRIPWRVVPALVTTLVLADIAVPGLIYTRLIDDAHFLSPIVFLPEFVIGCLLGLHLPQIVGHAGAWFRRHSTAVLAVCATVPLAFLIWELPEWPNPYVPFCVLAILAGAAGDLDGPHWLSDRRLVLAGLWSYAFYSIHAPLINGVQGLLDGEAPPIFVGLPLGVLTFVAIGAVSAAIFYLWEEPLRQRIGRRPPESQVVVPGQVPATEAGAAR